jgi:hypothetical protein
MKTDNIDSFVPSGRNLLRELCDELSVHARRPIQVGALPRLSADPWIGIGHGDGNMPRAEPPSVVVTTTPRAPLEPPPATHRERRGILDMPLSMVGRPTAADLGWEPSSYGPLYGPLMQVAS